MKTQQERLNEIQPNSTQRSEAMIVIDYLLNYGYDKNHPVKSTEIVKYAEEKFNLYFRRDRVTQVLIHLYQMSHDVNYNLPFKVDVLYLKEGMKFYISKRKYSEAELLDIVSALHESNNMSDTKYQKLEKLIIDSNFSEAQKQAFILKVNKRKKVLKKNRPTTGLENFVDIASTFMDNKTLVEFSITNHRGVGKSDTFEFSKNNYRGVIYKVLELEKSVKIVLYIPTMKAAVIVPVKYLKIAKKNEYKKFYNESSYPVIEKSSEVELDQWLKDYYCGKTGVMKNYHLKISYQPGDRDYEEAMKKFNTHWNTMDVKNDIVETVTKLPNGETINIKEQHLRFSANLESFLNFYEKMIVVKQFIIVEPKELNDHIFKDLIEQFVKRANTYGHKFEFEYNCKLKESLSASINETLTKK